MNNSCQMLWNLVIRLIWKWRENKRLVLLKTLVKENLPSWGKATLFPKLDMVSIQPLPISPKYWSSMWDILYYGNRNSYSHIMDTIFLRQKIKLFISITTKYQILFVTKFANTRYIDYNVHTSLHIEQRRNENELTKVNTQPLSQKPLIMMRNP